MCAYDTYFSLAADIKYVLSRYFCLTIIYGNWLSLLKALEIDFFTVSFSYHKIRLLQPGQQQVMASRFGKVLITLQN